MTKKQNFHTAVSITVMNISTFILTSQRPIKNNKEIEMYDSFLHQTVRSLWCISNPVPNTVTD